MKFKSFIFTLTALLSTTSCTNEEILKDENGDINLRLGISSLTTRAPQLSEDGSGNFSSDDKILMNFNSGNDNTFKDYYYGSTDLKWKDLPFSDRQPINIYGFYPYQEYSSNTITEIDASSGKYDLLIAKSQAVMNQTETIVMPFNHSLHRLNIIYKSSDNSMSEEELQAISTQFIGKSKARLDITKAEIIKDSESNVVEYNSQTGKHIYVIIIPQENKGLQLKSTICGKIKTINIPEVISGSSSSRFESGKQVNITLDVRKDNTPEGIYVEFDNMSINGWIDNGTIEGTVDI